MLETTQVVIVSAADMPPRECERCRTPLALKQAINGVFSMYECNYVLGETHRVYAISEWLAVHVMNAMTAFIERETCTDEPNGKDPSNG